MQTDSVLAGPLTAYDGAPTVGERLLGWVRSTPDAVALRCGDHTLTYAALYERAAGLAATVGRLGAGDGPLAVETAVPAKAVIGLVAAALLARPYLCAGGKQPPARTLDMVRQAGVSAFVHATSEGRSLAAQAGARAIDVAPEGAAGPPPEGFEAAPPGGEHALYVLFTSGSTGRPKGVVVGEPSVRNLLAWAAERFGIEPGWRFSQLADLSFDAHVLEVWLALATGGTVVAPERSPLGDPAGLRDWFASEEIDFAFVPTSLMPSLLANWGPGRQPAYLWAGGEQLKVRPGEDVETVIVNGYGPTETTVIVTAEEVAAGDVATLGLPDLGRPIANVTLAVVDPQTLAVRPVGERGELLVAGASLARGYLDPELDDRFVETDLGRPGAAPVRCYRTGDLVSVGDAGTLSYHGRIDRQIQVRGYRVEPGEVEATLLGHALVREASIKAIDDGPSQALVAYVVPAEAGTAVAPLVRALRDHLGGVLPDYMVPSFFEVLEDFPRTPGGKVDGDRLAPRGSSRIGLSTVFRAPRTALERLLCEIWEDELGLLPVGVDDDFFEVGGHSLVAIRVAERLANERSVRLDVTAFFQHPTIADLCASLPPPGAERAD
jgi:amino acid adenylation domain-containing protein